MTDTVLQAKRVDDPLGCFRDGLESLRREPRRINQATGHAWIERVVFLLRNRQHRARALDAQCFNRHLGPRDKLLNQYLPITLFVVHLENTE